MSKITQDGDIVKWSLYPITTRNHHPPNGISLQQYSRSTYLSFLISQNQSISSSVHTPPRFARPSSEQIYIWRLNKSQLCDAQFRRGGISANQPELYFDNQPQDKKRNQIQINKLHRWTLLPMALFFQIDPTSNLTIKPQKWHTKHPPSLLQLPHQKQANPELYLLQPQKNKHQETPITADN